MKILGTGAGRGYRRAPRRVLGGRRWAGHWLVGESMTNPGKYFRNNGTGSLTLADGMVQAGVHWLVFSSTAAVYGEPRQIPIREDDPHRPANVYGASKLAFEEL